MLQAIREFARERLAARSDEAGVRRRHVDYFLSVAETLGPQLWGPNQVAAYQLLRAEALDLRSALLWASQADGLTEPALRLIGHLSHYWELTDEAAQYEVIARAVVAGA